MLGASEMLTQGSPLRSAARIGNREEGIGNRDRHNGFVEFFFLPSSFFSSLLSCRSSALARFA